VALYLHLPYVLTVLYLVKWKDNVTLPTYLPSPHYEYGNRMGKQNPNTDMRIILKRIFLDVGRLNVNCT
jgi:hypothetical protein